MHRRQIIAFGGVSLVSLVLAPLSAAAAPVAEPLAVVVAKQGSPEGMSLSDLKRLFMGASMIGGQGQKLIALNRDRKSEERVGFDRTVLGMTPEQVARYWIDRKIRGQASVPKVIEPAVVLQRIVAKLPGAIAYVRVSEVSAEVKVLRVDGKRPGDPGYSILTGGSSTSLATPARFGLALDPRLAGAVAPSGPCDART